MQRLTSLLKQTVHKWTCDPGPRFAAALAFYTTLTIVPFVVLAVMAAGGVIGEGPARENVYEHLRELIGKPTADGLFHILQEWRTAGSPVLSEMVALGFFMFGTLRVMDQLQDALDCLWGIRPRPTLSFSDRVKRRFRDILQVFGIGLLLIASLTVSAWMSLTLRSILRAHGDTIWTSHAFEVIISFVVTTVLFAFIFKWVPQADVAWTDVWIGAFMTAGLYQLGSMLILNHIGQSPLVQLYGGAGSIVLVLLWAYYAAQILLFGAAFTAVYAERAGRGVRPTPQSVAAHPPSAGEYT